MGRTVDQIAADLRSGIETMRAVNGRMMDITSTAAGHPSTGSYPTITIELSGSGRKVEFDKLPNELTAAMGAIADDLQAVHESLTIMSQATAGRSDATYDLRGADGHPIDLLERIRQLRGA